MYGTYHDVLFEKCYNEAPPPPPLLFRVLCSTCGIPLQLYIYGTNPQKLSIEKGRVLDDGCGRSGLILGGGGAGDGEPPPPPLVYSIRSGDHRIGSFILHKAEFCAGDIVLGNFDFSGASTRCLQVREVFCVKLKVLVLGALLFYVARAHIDSSLDIPKLPINRFLA